MSYRVRFAAAAEDDLVRLYEFILRRDPSDFDLAERALAAIRQAIRQLEFSPFAFRKVLPDNPFLRELIIPFGASGFVALFEIDDAQFVSVLALRHQREDDYH